VLLQFVDIPEGHTSGATEAAAAEQALDCLIAALDPPARLTPRSQRAEVVPLQLAL
jgi:hypothetical protein